jgi:hypothetical protein
MRFAFHKFQDTRNIAKIISSSFSSSTESLLEGIRNCMEIFFRKFLGQINNSLSIQKLHGIVGFKVGNPYLNKMMQIEGELLVDAFSVCNLKVVAKLDIHEVQNFCQEECL